MDKFYEYVKRQTGISKSNKSHKYCNIGNTFHIQSDELDGIYWYYETENFIIDIHDFFIKKELFQSNISELKSFLSLSTSYILTGNGESFNPYQTISSNMLNVIDIDNIDKNYKFLLHANFPYLSVGINLKKHTLENYLYKIKNKNNISYSDIVLNNINVITKALEPLAKDILNCKMSSPAAEIFFEAKTKEWISLIIDSFMTKKEIKISIEDDEALKNVANYLDDHYAINVSQKTLEKISMMSGSKLKKLFKQKYQSSITEYTQRRRMNIAETLLLNSSLKIQDIAEAVGYSSHSKFSTCFKKYKGVFPKEIKKMSQKIFHK